MLAGFMRTQTLSTVAQLGVADVVSDVPMDVADIARRVGAHEAALYRLLRFVASEGVLAEVAPGRFVETPLSNGLRSDAPMTARWLAHAFGSEHYRAWSAARHTFVTGDPAFDQIYGRSFFDYLSETPYASRSFDRAMASGAQSRAAALLSYDWSGVQKVADIGGGNGAALSILLAAHPHLHGALFDRADVVDSATVLLRAAGVHDRCDIVGGDFFADVLPSADVYVLSQILHDWNDERAGALFDNCRRSLTAGAWLLARARFQLREITPDGLIDARPS